MPHEASDIYATVFKNGTATFLARVVGWDALPLVPAGLLAVQYSVFLLDPAQSDHRTVVAGHHAVPLSPPDVLLAPLQFDPRWTLDDVGYNFRHTIPIAAAPAFEVAGRDYLVEYRLTPASGPAILIRFRLHAI